jgi:hypothetical protein
MSKSYHHITPSNKPANGIISFKGGQPLLNFMIGEQERYLLGSTIRLNGTFNVFTGQGQAITVPQNVSLDPRIGMLSVIDMLTISTKRTNRTLEQIRHYGRFMSSFLPMTSGENDFIGPYSGLFGATINEQISQQQLMYAANYANDTSADGTNDGIEFSLPLMCGMFSGQNPIPLSMNWGLGGITIQINLAPDLNVFKAAASTNAYYELSDVYLSCEIAMPPPDQLSQLMSQTSGQFEYNSISSYYDTVNASYATINFNLGLSRVLSLWTSFIRTSEVNNELFNGFTTFPLRNSDSGGNLTVASITKVNFLRGGLKFPIQYQLESDPAVKPINPQLLRTYVNAISTFTDVQRTCLSLQNTNNANKVGGLTLPEFSVFKGGPIYGVGVAFDAISDLGADFSQQQFGLVIESKLETDSPHGAYVFCHARNVLTYGPGGVNIIM